MPKTLAQLKKQLISDFNEIPGTVSVHHIVEKFEIAGLPAQIQIKLTIEESEFITTSEPA